jgi:hypothetical protein
MRRRTQTYSTTGRLVPPSNLSLFFSTSQLAGRTRTKRNYSFRVFSGLEEIVDQLVAEGMEQSEALNHILAYALESATEGQTFAPLFSFEAGKRDLTVAQTITQLAIERLREQYPDLSRDMALPRKK